MPDLQAVGERLKTRLNIFGGGHFNGYVWTSQMRNLPDTSFVTPRRYVRVEPRCLARPGMVVDHLGVKHLLAEDREEGFRGEHISRTFRMIVMHSYLALYRSTNTTDTVTGAKKSPTSPTHIKSIWINFEPIRMQNDEVKVPKRVDRFITGEALQLGDLIGDRVVQSVSQQLGVCVGEIL